MMLDWLGHGASGDAIRKAVRKVFSERHARTPDMGGALTTTQMTEVILGAMG